MNIFVKKEMMYKEGLTQRSDIDDTRDTVSRRLQVSHQTVQREFAKMKRALYARYTPNERKELYLSLKN